jgi:hypothetical protein
MSLAHIAVLLAASANYALADVVAWYASSNDTPAAVGWTLNNSSGAPIVPSPDSMLIGPSTFSGLANFSFDLTPLGPAGVPVSLEVTARIQEATYGNMSGFLRGGYEMYLTDGLGRYVVAEIGPAAVALRTDNAGLASPTFAINTTDTFHTYLLTIDAGQATLSIDGQPVLSDSLSSAGALPDTASFGDGTILGSSTSRTRRAILSTGVPPCSGADLVAPFGVLNFFDVAEFINRFNAQDPSTDLAAPFGTYNFFDVSAYIALYNQGCL